MQLMTSLLRKGATVLVATAAMTGVALSGAGIASAQPNLSPQHSGSVNVGATVSGSGIDPTTECAWVLTDDNLLGGSETQQYSSAIGANIGPVASGLSYVNYTQPVQGNGWSASTGGPNAPSYGGAPNNLRSLQYGLDDNPTFYPTPPPCDVSDSGNVTMAAGTQSNPTATDVSVLPNAFDETPSGMPAPRRVEFWAAEEGAAQVTFNVFYPDGAEAAEVGGVEISNCQTYGNTGALLTNMFAAAGPAPTGANELSAAAIDNVNGTGIVNLCNEGQKSLWHQAFTISKDDPNGTYTVEVISSNTSGGQSVSWFSFIVIPFFDLATDFNSLSFTNNGNGQYQVTGNTTWSPPSSTHPTVTNGGNSGEEIGVAFGKLSYTPSGGSPVFISEFDANIGYNSQSGNILPSPGITNIAASTTPTYLGSSGANSTAKGPQLVCPNDASKLDLSAEPPSGAPAGTYSGTMQVWAESDVLMGSGSGGCMTDNGAPYVVTTSTGPAFKNLLDQDQWPLVRA